MHLTRAEEQVMQILWDLGEGLVRDVRELFPDPKPVRNTVSTIIRILERKKDSSDIKLMEMFIYYYPLVSKELYSKSQLLGLMEDYFDNSFPAMVSFFAKETDLTIGELDKVLDGLGNELKGGMKNE